MSSTFADAGAPAPSTSIDLSYSEPAPAPAVDASHGTSVSLPPPSVMSAYAVLIGDALMKALVFILALLRIVADGILYCWRRVHNELVSTNYTPSSMQTAPPAGTFQQAAAHVSNSRPLSGSVQAGSSSVHSSVSRGGSVFSSSHNGSRSFSYEQLRVATKNFSDSELLGRGGSGAVYRGRLPADGTLVAVKCIPEGSNQGAKEFNAEVSIISELRHRNLVKLLGWCQDRGRFLLVYSYMPNGSLDYLLYKDDLCVKLHWGRRYEIAMGLGAALLYLHGECESVIIHRDVKSSNVLLDESFTAKLGDFGLSRQVDVGATSHMTTAVAGTRGYMAPECFFGSGKSTCETDVYAFGAVLLELVTGRRPLDGRLREYDGVLVDWVWDLYRKGRVLQAVDQRLGVEWEREEARRMLVVGLACSHPDAQGRPKMRRAVEALSGTVAVPPLPDSKPGVSFGASPPVSLHSTESGISTSTSTSHGSSSLYSASSYDSAAFNRPTPSHFAR